MTMKDSNGKEKNCTTAPSTSNMTTSTVGARAASTGQGAWCTVNGGPTGLSSSMHAEVGRVDAAAASPTDRRDGEGPGLAAADAMVGGEIPETDGGMYVAVSVEAVPRALDKWGVTILRVPGLREHLTGEVLKGVELFAKDTQPIFKGVRVDESGKYVDEVVDGKPTGYHESNYGSKKRRQILIKPQDQVLQAFCGVLAPIINEVAGASGLKRPIVHPPNLLLNLQDEGRTPVGRQGWHTDLSEGQEGFVLIAAVQNTSLLVFPESHMVVKEFWRLDDLVDNKVIPESDLTAWIQMRTFRPLRLRLTPGDVVFLGGHTVHAGDRGVDGQPSFRLHWNVTESKDGRRGPKSNETRHLHEYGEPFAKAFE
ncbi:hypothetical protein PLESTM_000942500 [Pleodorina starrii]|nr:hypothetical protein PLESTM_000942500 [Pleodorina starrii]